MVVWSVGLEYRCACTEGGDSWLAIWIDATNSAAMAKKQNRASGEVMKVMNPMVSELLQADLERDEGGENDVARLVGLGGEGMQLSQHTEQLLREAFNIIDHDNDGELMHSELDAVLHVLGAKPTTEEVAQLLNHLDADKDGDVEIDDWVAACLTGTLQIADHDAVMDLHRLRDIRSAFVRMDTTRTAYWRTKSSFLRWRWRCQRERPPVTWTNALLRRSGISGPYQRAIFAARWSAG